MESPSDRIQRVKERIAEAAHRSGRDPQEITLVAVTKTVPFERVLPFIQTGIQHVAENRVQEALEKYQAPDGSRRLSQSIHLIGQLQSNKAKKAAAFFDLIQSMDRLELAEDLSRHGVALKRTVDCLVQVKISEESTKSGIALEQAETLVHEASKLPSVRIRGLMGIAPLSGTAEEARPWFSRLRKLFEKLKLDVLSMGMSGDYEVAISEGSTMVRIGTALFGARSQ